MNDTLRNQLVGLGFKPAPKPVAKPAGEHRGRNQPARKPLARADAKPQGAGHGRKGGGAGVTPNRGKPGTAGSRGPGGGRSAGQPRSREDIDLAKAYAIRAQREKDERIAAEKAKQEEARKRREARAKVAELIKDKGLNVAEADIARHFSYGGKIKRVYVTRDQLKALNAGELGVLQQDGRYLLVPAMLLVEAEAIFPAAVALKVDPDAPVTDDPYADPQFQVPDDLVW